MHCKYYMFIEHSMPAIYKLLVFIDDAKLLVIRNICDLGNSQRISFFNVFYFP